MDERAEGFTRTVGPRSWGVEMSGAISDATDRFVDAIGAKTSCVQLSPHDAVKRLVE